MAGKRFRGTRRPDDQSKGRTTIRQLALRPTVPGFGTPRRNPAINLNPMLLHSMGAQYATLLEFARKQALASLTEIISSSILAVFKWTVSEIQNVRLPDLI